jgi:hypothetical protein
VTSYVFSFVKKVLESVTTGSKPTVSSMSDLMSMTLASWIKMEMKILLILLEGNNSLPHVQSRLIEQHLPNDKGMTWVAPRQLHKPRSRQMMRITKVKRCTRDH